MKVICINNKNKPNEIPNNKWNLLIEGECYTVTKLMRCNVQGGILGFRLAEIPLGPESSPYEYFAAHRFGIPIKEGEPELMEEELEFV